MAMENVYIHSIHGINALSPEETMRNMGRLGREGMRETDKEIIKIMMN